MMRVIRGLAAFAAAGFFMVAQAVAVPTIEDLLFESVSVVSLSPDGRWLVLSQNAARAARNKKKSETSSILVVVDLEGQNKPLQIPMGEVRLSWVRWASNEKFVARTNSPIDISVCGQTIWRDITANKTITIDRRDGSVFEIFKGKRAEQELEGGGCLSRGSRIKKTGRGVDLGANASIIDALPDDPDHMVMSANLVSGSGIYKVNINNGDTETLFVGAERESYSVNSNFKPVFKSRFNQRSRLVQWFGSDDEGKSWYPVSEYIAFANQPPQFRPVAYTENPDQMVVIAPRRGDAPTGLYIYDVKKRDYVSTVYEHPLADISSYTIGNDGTRRERITIADRKFERFYTEKKYQRIQEGLEDYFGPDLDVVITQWSGDESKALVYVSGPAHPGSYHLFDRKKSSIDLLFRAHSFDYSELGQTEVLEATMSDGRNIYSYVTHPVGGKNKKAPLIILPHGGPQARDYFDWSFIAEPQVFASRGYRVIQTQFRGGGGYGASFAAEGHREWGGRMQKDVYESAQVLIDRGLAEKKNIGVWGWSYGGYVAGASAFMNTDVISCAVAGAGVYDLVEMLEYERRGGASSPGFQYWTKAIGDPTSSEEKDRMNAASVAKNVDKITVPIMLLHGQDDFIVPVEQSRILRDAMKRAKKGKLLTDYQEYLYEGHTPTLINWVDIWERSLDFFGECLEK